MSTSTAPVLSGDIIAGKYLVDRVLGQGGMGVVVAASHLTLNQRVALKFLLPEACAHPGAIERFLREARAAVRIQSEHVARVTDVGTLDTGSPYMVMEFLQGHDLAQEIETEKVLTPADIARYVLQACEALAEAHALGIVHRDLKPANLFLAERKDGTRTVKVLDFGISKAVQEGEVNLTQTASMMGSPLYMAPEQIRSAKSVDARADVWSLGVILHEALAGSAPFGGDTLSGVLAAIVADPVQPLSELRGDLPPGFAELVAHCLEKDPKKRVQNVAELASLLAQFAPAQAGQSLPRIRAVLGHTAAAVTTPHGTPDVLAATAMGTAPVGTPPGGVAPLTTAPRGTAPPWTTNELPLHGGARGRTMLFASAGLGLLLLGGGGVFFAMRDGGDAEAAAVAPVVPGAPSPAPATELQAPAPPAVAQLPAQPSAQAAPPASAEPVSTEPVPSVATKSKAKTSSAQAAASKSAVIQPVVSPTKPAAAQPAAAPASASPLDGRR